MSARVARLVLGPLLRYVGATEATFWVETDAACEVEVLGARARTFCVEGHHFALVVVEDLSPATVTPYEVALDGERVWPEEGSRFPPSVVKTPPADASSEPVDIVFGSCRVSVPHTEPYTLPKDVDERGRERDSLRALAVRMIGQPPERWPHALLWLGDQVYADEVSPQTRAFIRTRRDVDRPPGETVADLEEYCSLYRESWGEPTLRWLLSTVSSAMIFDDHDVHDDWNTSQAWVDEMRAKPWWDERIVSALVTYWCYQHLGNLSPRDLAQDDLWARVTECDDAGSLLREFAFAADRETDGARWSYCRDLGPARLVMIDSRAGRVLGVGERSMLDDDEWAWLAKELRGGCDHLLVGTSLPWLLAPGMHDLEAWNEAVCAGAWGKRFARLGERIRQGLDLEHWAAFRESFERLGGLVRGVAEGPDAPATVVALSGDVHHAYLSEVAFDRPTAANVFQAVCSPFRNPLDARERRAIRLARSRVGTLIGAALARGARVPRPSVRWADVHPEPWFDNQVMTLRLHGRSAELVLEKTVADDGELHEVFRHRLA